MINFKLGYSYKNDIKILKNTKIVFKNYKKYMRFVLVVLKAIGY